MPLNANFLADFSSFLNATQTSIAASKEFEAAAGAVGPAVDKSLEQAGKASATAGEGASKAAEKIKTDWIGVAKDVGGAVMDVAGSIQGFAAGFIGEFAEAQAATARLEAALKSAGLAAPGVAEAYGRIATELQTLSAFSDEAITDAMSIFTTVGNIKPAQMDAVMTATTELARGMGIDLPAATKLMAKAAATDGAELGKLSVILGDSVKKGDNFETVLDAIFKQFSGQNAAYIGTTAGHLDQMKNQMSDINEQIGEVFAKNLETIFGWFQKLPESIQTFVLAAASIGAVIGPVIGALKGLIAIFGATGLGAGIMTFFEWLLPWLGPVGWIALGVLALVTAITIYWEEIVAGIKWLWAEILRVVGEKIAVFKAEWARMVEIVRAVVPQIKAIFDQIVQIAAGLYQGIKTWLQDKLTALVNYVATLPGKIVGAFQWAYNALIGFSIVPDLIKGIGRQFGALDRVMVAPAWDAAAEATAAFASIGDAAIPTLGAGAGRGGGSTAITINMTGMMGTDDPQTRAALRDAVSNAMIEAMRGQRRLGTA